MYIGVGVTFDSEFHFQVAVSGRIAVSESSNAQKNTLASLLSSK